MRESQNTGNKRNLLDKNRALCRQEDGEHRSLRVNSRHYLHALSAAIRHELFPVHSLRSMKQQVVGKISQCYLRALAGDPSGSTNDRSYPSKEQAASDHLGALSCAAISSDNKSRKILPVIANFMIYAISRRVQGMNDLRTSFRLG